MKTNPGRRAHRRRAVQLEVSITLKGPSSKHIGASGEGLTLVGRTKNLSEAGVAFVVSAGNIDRYLKRKDLPFEIKLNLPGGLIQLQARPIHYTRHPTSGSSASYLIGSCFLEVPRQQLDTLVSFIRTLPPSD
ncbi:MAG: PilZ domain-containing protein [Pyrinomonadaceae bacterium]